PDQSARMYLETREALKRCAQEAAVDFEVQAEWSFGGDIRFDPDFAGSWYPTQTAHRSGRLDKCRGGPFRPSLRGFPCLCGSKVAQLVVFLDR
ncbi:MAG: hypothetical protein NTY64_05050, partial [Deltaproteobacteria bacterium]|nr:hypothetical protein [Deltaproteobacteria bacterium]